MADTNTARVPCNDKLVEPISARDGTPMTPEGGVLGFISQFGNRTKFTRIARQMGVRIHGELVRKWIVSNTMPDNIYNTLVLATRSTDIVNGDTFIEVSFKGVSVGQFYLNPDVSLIIKKVRLK